MDADLDLDLDLTPPPVPPLAPALLWTARCPTCRRLATADANDVFRFVRGRWPDCCGVAVTFRVVYGCPAPAGGTKV